MANVFGTVRRIVLVVGALILSLLISVFISCHRLVKHTPKNPEPTESVSDSTKTTDEDDTIQEQPIHRNLLE